MKQTRSFNLQRSASKDLPTAPQTTSFVGPKKYSPPLIQFPTSPQLILGEEMIHFSHPQHPLSQLNLPDHFNCMGCKEFGAGLRFSCQQCDFQLHQFCALAPPAFKGHPFHSQHQLVFYSKPVKGGGSKSKCDVCGNTTKGYAFRCSACGFQMHPCCAMLSTEVNFPCHPHTLRLLPASNTTSNGDPGVFVCGECKIRRRSGRVYHCCVCEYRLHAVCAKDMVNGLYANGIKGLEKPSTQGGSRWHFASEVVVKILGGLLEGLAEGFGEGLVQNVGKGKGTTSRRIQ